ncbi:trifunctional transcriptional activator/DNA repair protein Ada/methylated-DNA--[protein]-cysteine S-methyltransferase [Paenibacillus sp.]|uniref:bifunctional transcriptional activator/DNA repair enzyme AdaA n=1 Tax=Paenibacillus sp. TaxID=58172 RepID=UPI002D26916B|nr:trifunctional transcriptional activator/DNA repair protein Ada/methylated-DNA--[protein]-cysteine S-methyltransferase [Paenibacillus sp.]HZG88435.1 trifunctional transcriptional activator/DNA repair protein Ada/methylated-DNA--[protein]-cysteine S-methyltransferase [Paenibacillus sp.]
MIAAERERRHAEFYKALVEKNSDYEGVFYVGVKTTGVFCRPTCPARKPKPDNCEFFETAQQALLASYRPCRRCRPLSPPNGVSDVVRALVEAVEANPEKRWRTSDFKALSVDESTARRQFKKRFGMTFVEYARARRMGIALKGIRAGQRVIDAQLSTGYESGSGFRDAFSKIMGAAPALLGKDGTVLKASWIDTPLGPMLAVADEQALVLLEFVDRRGLEREVERLRLRTKSAVVPGDAAPIRSIERELAQYFEGSLTEFRTPLRPIGTPFQQSVWEQLLRIPPGETRSYLEIAAAIGKPSACRAVAQANGANQLAIVIPCHRVINASGELGGYGGGVARKEWLLRHERRGAP